MMSHVKWTNAVRIGDYRRRLLWTESS